MGINVKFCIRKDFMGVFPDPVPARKVLPDFFSRMPPLTNKSDRLTPTVKKCVPFLDALSIGYIIPLWLDMNVSITGSEYNITFPKNCPWPNPLGTHSQEQLNGHPRNKDIMGDVNLKLNNPWIIETPKGYSCLFTSPLNHLEKRFKVLDAIVDTDKYYNPINFPFLWTGGLGDFFIPKGTPFMHVIPFKRETASFSVVEQNEKKKETFSKKLSTVFLDGYRTLSWHKSKENKGDI